MTPNEMDTLLAKHLGHEVLGLAYVYEDEMSCINIRPEIELDEKYPDGKEREFFRQRKLRPVMLRPAGELNCDVSHHTAENMNPKWPMVHGHEESCLVPVEPYSTNTDCASNLLVEMGKLHKGFEVDVHYRPWLLGDPWYAELESNEFEGNADGSTFADAVSKAVLFFISTRPETQEVEEIKGAMAVPPAPAAASVDTRPVQDKAPVLVVIFILTTLSLAIGVMALLKIANMPAFVVVEQKLVKDGPK